MILTREQFSEFYPDIKDRYDIFERDPSSDDDFIENYLASKIWRMNNIYTIVDKYGEKIPFVMNYSQHKVYAACREHARIIILKSRQQGISTFWLVSFFDDAIFLNDHNIGLMAQGTDEASTLLERAKLMWDELDVEIKNFLQLRLTKDNTKEFAFSNGCTIFIRTSFRSATLQRLHISELGKIANKYPDRAKETKTGTLQALAKGNPGIIESTAEGNNMFREEWDKAVAHNGRYTAKDFKPVFLSWLDDPDCVLSNEQTVIPKHREYFEELELKTGRILTPEQRNFWIAQERELGGDIFQEYPSTPDEAFTAVRDGTYYARLVLRHITKKQRVVPNLFDRNLHVDVVMDLGMNDDFVLGFWQWHKGQERLIDEYRNSGEGLEHYVNVINERCREYGYEVDEVYCPHDIKVRELGTGKTRLHKLRELGLRRIKVLPKAAVNDGIELVRQMIPNLWIDQQCTYSLDCLNNYSKEWDDRLGVWKNKPLHDEWSHGADMIRMRALGRREILKARQQIRRVANSCVVDGMSI